MRIIDSPAALARALNSPLDPALTRLLTLRRDQLLDDTLFIVVQPGDSLDGIEQAVGFPIAANLVDETTFPDPDFLPSWEWVQMHDGWYEIAYVLSDDGSGAVLLVPRRDDIDPTLYAILRAFAFEDADTNNTHTAI